MVDVVVLLGEEVVDHVEDMVTPSKTVHKASITAIVSI